MGIRQLVKVSLRPRPPKLQNAAGISLAEKGRPHPQGEEHHSSWAPGDIYEEGQHLRKKPKKGVSGNNCILFPVLRFWFKLEEVANILGDHSSPERERGFNHR